MNRHLKRVVLLVLMIAIAWAASNGPWADVAPQPLPVALALRPVTVAAERNGFVDMQGLRTAAGEDANAAGRAAMEAALRGLSIKEEILAWPTAPRWQCRPFEADCVALWRREADALRAELQLSAELGRRCERLAAADAYEELVAERPASGPLASASWAALPIARFANLTHCTRWLAMQAALETDPVRAEQWLVRADHLARKALMGSRSLIGNMVGLAMVQNVWLFAAQRIAAGGMDRAVLVRLLAPLPPEVLSPRHWAPEEARFAREMMRDLAGRIRDCGRAIDPVTDEPAPLSVETVLCHLQLGALPEQSVQDSDAPWLARLASIPASGPASCAQLQASAWREPAQAWPHWRNTLARFALDTPTHWGLYAARQADLELLRQTLQALSRGEPPPAGASLQPDNDGLAWRGCRALLAPDDKGGVLHLPSL